MACWMQVQSFGNIDSRWLCLRHTAPIQRLTGQWVEEVTVDPSIAKLLFFPIKSVNNVWDGAF